MGTDMRAHLEYNQTGNHWVSLSSWDLVRDYEMYRLLANVRGEGALYPPRGVPQDAGGDASAAYFMPVVETEEEVRRRAGFANAIARADAERAVARGWSAWHEDHGRRYINDPELHHGSWLTTAELRRVVDHYLAHALDFRWQRHRALLARMRDTMTDAKYARRLATPDWDTGLAPEERLHGEFRILLAAMEAGEVRGLRMRLVFWFHG